MQQKVVFKLDVFEERIKQRAMKVVCEFPGVTLIDVKEHGKLKVTGEFDKYQMTKKLKKIYEYVDIIALEQDGESKEKPNPVKKPEPIVKKTPKEKKTIEKKTPQEKKTIMKKTSSFRGWKIGFF